MERGLLDAWAQHAATTLTRLVATSDSMVPHDWQRLGYFEHNPGEGLEHAGVLAPLACLRALRCLCLDGAPMRPRQEQTAALPCKQGGVLGS